MFSLLFNRIIEELYFKQKGNLALYDRLTGIYNYNWFNLIGNKKYLNKDIYVSVIDINGFKEINDTYGHLHGNKVLKNVAEQLENLKSFDSSINVVRYGGDEFVVLSEANPYSLLKMCVPEPKLLSYGVVKKNAYEPLSVAFVKADKEMYDYKLEFKSQQKKSLGK